jgi:hypothetical protein
VDVEEFGGAAVEADALALVEVALAVVGGHALLCADPREAGRQAVSISGTSCPLVQAAPELEASHTGCASLTASSSRPLLRQSSLPRRAGDDQSQGRTFSQMYF